MGALLLNARRDPESERGKNIKSLNSGLNWTVTSPPFPRSDTVPLSITEERRRHFEEGRREKGIVQFL